MMITPFIADEIEDKFDRWIIGAIKAVGNSEGVSLAFVLISCGIDYLAGFNAGKQAKGQDYKNFLNEHEWFRKKYCVHDLYHSLRCGLVHNFTIHDNKFALIHKNSKLHLTKNKEGATILNYEDFLKDFVKIKNEYFESVRDPNSGKFTNFIKRFKVAGFLFPMPLNK